MRWSKRTVKRLTLLAFVITLACILGLKCRTAVMQVDLNRRLAVAVCTCDETAVHALLKAGADPNAKTQCRWTVTLRPLPLFRLVQSGKPLLEQAIDGTYGYGIHKAADAFASCRIAKDLLIKGANPDVRSTSGETQLCVVSSQPIDCSHFDEFLDSESRFGHGPDLSKLRIDLVRSLLAAGADPNAASKEGKTVVTLASPLCRLSGNFMHIVDEEDVKIVELLMLFGADASAASSDGMDAISVARSEHNFIMLPVLYYKIVYYLPHYFGSEWITHKSDIKSCRRDI